MKIFALAPQNLLTKTEWEEIKRFSDVEFIDKDVVGSNEKSCLLLDPDYFDWKLPENFFEKFTNLKAVCLTTTTQSYIDKDYLDKKNVKIYNLPKYSTESVAEYLIFFMFCLAKKLPLQLKNESKQDFSQKYLQTELLGKTAGIIGYGNIGQSLSKKLDAFGMKVLYWNRTNKDCKFKKVELEKLFKQSDVIFVTLANNESTRKIITDKMLLSMKKSAIFISNTGVELHNDKIIRKMLEDKKLFGFGAEIPNKCCDDYFGNAMITSEYAWFTSEAVARRKKAICKNLMEIVNG